MRARSKLVSYSLVVAVIASLGGFLFGYNTSVIAGAMLFLVNDLGLTTLQEELVVSTLLIGALFGALGGGFLNDALGRKKTLFGTAFLFFIGTLCLTMSRDFDELLVGRFLSGFGIGIASVTVPLYIAEIAPSEHRGFYVSLNQLMITIGVLTAYIVCYLYAESQEWREMFGFAFIPLAVQFVGLFFIPETPSWLITHKQSAKAEKILHQLRVANTKEYLVEIEKKEDAPQDQRWSALFQPRIRKAFLIGIGMSVFQQITGINAVIYYAPRIFQMAGYREAEMATFVTMLLGAVNMAMTVVALWLIDRIGRRPLLIIGLSGMSVSLLVLGYAFSGRIGEAGILAVIALMTYISFFAISLGPIAWLIISEIYPLGVRGRAMGAATFANWGCNYLVSLTFLSLVTSLGAGLTFWFYMLIAFIGLWFIYKMLPETKGKTFEQIQRFWKKS
ncbi:MAG: sugar porter family MFS transporter [Chlamydiales bacterium]|nr:sugar porter family MFS transporter [Chlamydiales bacterium]